MDETVFSLDVCCICLETILIPVEPVCFKCKDQDDGKISCFSMKRLCLTCLEGYLDLRKNRYDRCIKKKCLFCPKTTYPHEVPKHKLFRVDYLSVSKDMSLRTCPMPGCSFRDTHLQVVKHVFSDCLYYYVECECGIVCKRADVMDHCKACHKFMRCQLCAQYMLKSLLMQHMYYEHDMTKCFTCHNYVKMGDLSAHILSQCPDRLVPCDICQTFIRYQLLKNHLHRHVTDIKKKVQTLYQKICMEEVTLEQIKKILSEMPAT